MGSITANPYGGGCVPCPVNYVAQTDQDGNGQCVKCLYGAKCAGGQAFPGGLGIYADYGFWQPMSQRRDVMPTLVFYPCPFLGACLNASVCATGYQGVLCAACVPDWQIQGQTCIPCQGGSGSGNILLGIGIILILFLVAMVYNEWSYNQRIKNKLNAVSPQLVVRNIFNLLRTDITGSIATATVQV